MPRALTGNPVLRAFSSLLTAQVFAMGLGYLYWLYATHQMSGVEVGASTALVNSMTLVGNVTSLGAPVVAAAELPNQDQTARTRTIQTLLMVVSGPSIVIGTAFPFVAERLSATYGIAFDSPVTLIAFPLGVCLIALGNVSDQASVAIRRNSYPVVRNLVASVTRFGFSVALWTTLRSGHAELFTAWVLALLIGGSLVARRLLRGAHWRSAVRQFPRDLRGRRGLLTDNFFLSLALLATGYVVPLVGAAALSPSGYAPLAIAWLLAAIAFVPPFMLAESMLAGSGHMSDAAFYRTVRRTLPGSAVLSALLICGTVVLGHLLLAFYGGNYASDAYHLWIVVLVAGPALVVKDHYFAIARVRRRFRLASASAAVALSFEVAGAVVGATVGRSATWLCVGWVLGVYGTALLMAPPLLRWVRHSGDRETRAVLSGSA